MPFAVVVTFEVAANKMDGFMSILRENAATSRSEEPGCTQFDIATDPSRPNEVFIYVIYTDVAAYKAHKLTPHFINFVSKSEELIVDREIWTYANVAQ